MSGVVCCTDQAALVLYYYYCYHDLGPIFHSTALALGWLEAGISSRDYQGSTRLQAEIKHICNIQLQIHNRRITLSYYFSKAIVYFKSNFTDIYIYIQSP